MIRCLKAYSSTFLILATEEPQTIDLTTCCHVWYVFYRSLFSVYFGLSVLIVSQLGPFRLALFLFTVSTASFSISSIPLLSFALRNCMIVLHVFGSIPYTYIQYTLRNLSQFVTKLQQNYNNMMVIILYMICITPFHYQRTSIKLGYFKYSGTCLMWSPMGPNFFGWIRQVAAFQRCLLIFIITQKQDGYFKYGFVQLQHRYSILSSIEYLWIQILRQKISQLPKYLVAASWRNFGCCHHKERGSGGTFAEIDF